MGDAPRSSTPQTFDAAAKADEDTGAAEPAPTPDGAAAATHAAPPADPATSARRALRLVVSCRPEGDRYRVLLALGADGCDPVFRNAVVDGLARRWTRC